MDMHIRISAENLHILKTCVSFIENTFVTNVAKTNVRINFFGQILFE